MNQLARNWWLLALRGVLGLVLGIVAFLMPATTLAALVLVFGAFAFVDGIALVAMGIRERRHEKRWWGLILQGLLGILAGIITLFVPLATALALLAIVAAWAIVTGGIEIAAAIRLRQVIKGEWLLLLSGALSVVLGVALVLMPGPGLLALTWMVGAYMLASGVLLLALAYRLRGYKEFVETIRPRTANA